MTERSRLEPTSGAAVTLRQRSAMPSYETSGNPAPPLIQLLLEVGKSRSFRGSVPIDLVPLLDLAPGSNSADRYCSAKSIRTKERTELCGAWRSCHYFGTRQGPMT